MPWLGFFDPIVTESATRGFYVVYLINPQTQDIYLSLNQGTTAVYEEFGRPRGEEVLKRRAKDISQRVSHFADVFDESPIDLGSTAPLPMGYTAGHAFGRRYRAGEIEEESFYSDLTRMLAAYESLIDLGGTTPSDVMQEESGTANIEETRNYILSRRIERAPNVRAPVLQRRGAICEACGLDPSLHFGYDGPIKNVPLDIHHSKPIHHLAEGESRRYRIPDDFLVLCPTCHRMIHKQYDPSDLDALLRRINFLLTTKTKNST